MKKKTLSILLFLITAMFLVSCGKNTNKEEFKAVTYSNLLDKESRDYVKESLEKARVPEKNIESFFKQVDYFNKSIGEYGLVKEGFKEKIKTEADYDPYKMQDLWNEKNKEFMGYNCRITSYNLMKDLIDIGEFEKKDSNILIFDENAINNSPNIIFNQEELDGFKTLYHEINTDKSKDLDVHVKNVKDYWKSKNISFKSKDASLISVFFHEEDGFLFVGHVGVLVPGADGNLVFIEKVAFQEPYQAIIFKDRSELNDYLMGKYDNSWGQETISPFIMENDELMEGYKVVSKDK